MRRVAVLSIVLTSLAGPNATLLCRIWCDSHRPARVDCHHEPMGTAPAVTGVGDCDDMGLTGAVFVLEDVRRGVTERDAQDADFVARYQLAPSASKAGLGSEMGRGSPPDNRPPVTALRI